MAHAIEAELVRATGFKPNPKKSRQEILVALAEAVDKLPEKRWGRLSPSAQTWANKATAALDSSKPIADFPNGAIKKKAAKPKPVDDDDDAKPATEGNFQTLIIHSLIKHNGAVSASELVTELSKAGFDPSPLSVSHYKSHFSKVVKVLQDCGLLKKKIL